MSETVRVFVALHLPEIQRRVLEVVIASLREQGLINVRWVHPEGIHLTLKFLGDISESQLELVSRAMTEAAGESAPFHLQLSTLGVFPNLKRARILWCGAVDQLRDLSALQERMEGGLEALGYPREARPFSLHITLGRVRDGNHPPDPALLQQALEACTPSGTEPWLVNEACLMRTTPLPGGSRYDVIAKAKLRSQS